MADGPSDLTKQRIRTLYPGLRPLAFRVLQDVKIMTKLGMHVTDALRSFDQQLAAYSKGRTLDVAKNEWVVTKPGEIVTNSKPGLSFHCYGLAFDCAFDGVDPYLEKDSNRVLYWKSYADVVKSHGMRAGADFRLINGVSDLPHAEMTYGLTISECLELYNNGGLVAVWAYIDTIRGISTEQDWGIS